MKHLAGLPAIFSLSFGVASIMGMVSCKPRPSISESKSIELSSLGDHILVWQSGNDTIYANACQQYVSDEDARRARESTNPNETLAEICGNKKPPLEFDRNSFQALLESVTLSDILAGIGDMNDPDDRVLLQELIDLRNGLTANIKKIDELKQLRNNFGPKFIELEKATADVNRISMHAQEASGRSAPVTEAQIGDFGGDEYSRAKSALDALQPEAESIRTKILQLTDEILLSEVGFKPILEKRQRRINEIMEKIASTKELTHLSTISVKNLDFWLLHILLTKGETMSKEMVSTVKATTSTSGTSGNFTFDRVRGITVVTDPGSGITDGAKLQKVMREYKFDVSGGAATLPDRRPLAINIYARSNYDSALGSYIHLAQSNNTNAIFLMPSSSSRVVGPKKPIQLSTETTFAVSQTGKIPIALNAKQCVQIVPSDWQDYYVKVYYRAKKYPDCYSAFLYKLKNTSYSQPDVGWIGIIGSDDLDGNTAILPVMAQMVSDIRNGVSLGDPGVIDTSSSSSPNGQVVHQPFTVKKVTVVPQANQVQLISQPTTPTNTLTPPSSVTPIVSVSNTSNQGNQSSQTPPQSNLSAAIPIPLASTTSLALAEAEVLAAMNEAKATFHVNVSSPQKVAPRIVDQGVVEACLGNATSVGYWSDIVFHYYCQLGQLRACFTGQVQNAKAKDYASYEQAYNVCAATDQNFKWISDDATRSQIFKHVMFSVYAAGKANVFNRDAQDRVINTFYGVGNPNNSQDCTKRLYLPRQPKKIDPYFRVKGQHCH